MGGGGKREGAGRKAGRGERKESLTVRVTPTLREYLNEQDASAADVIEDAIRKTKRFKDWLASRG